MLKRQAPRRKEAQLNRAVSPLKKCGKSNQVLTSQAGFLAIKQRMYRPLLTNAEAYAFHYKGLMPQSENLAILR